MDHPRTDLGALPPVFIALAVKAALLFGAAGSLRWWQAWAFVACDLAFSLLAALWLYRDKAELLEERKTAAKTAKSWDKKLVPLLVLVLPTLLLVLAGLDRRLGWSAQSSPAVPMAGLAALLAGNALFFWAHRSNPFFSSFARIQTERGHQVADQGPYRWVRHPGYAGLMVSSLGLSLLLGGWAVLTLGLAIAALYALRTALEDRMLLEELEGYRDYAGRVRARLVPGLW